MEYTQSISCVTISSLVPCSSRLLERHIAFNISALRRLRDDFPILCSMNALSVLSIFSWSWRLELDASTLDSDVDEPMSPSSEVCGGDVERAGSLTGWMST